MNSVRALGETDASLSSVGRIFLKPNTARAYVFVLVVPATSVSGKELSRPLSKVSYERLTFK